MKLKKAPQAPAWLNGAILYQLRLDTFTPEGTFAAAEAKLEYIRSLGVSVIYLAPVYEANTDPREGCVKGRFCNFDVKEIDHPHPAFGTAEDFKRFVGSAHRLGMKVILEIVPHGVSRNSGLAKAHPEWFRKDADGNLAGTWGMYDFDWSNAEFTEYWVGNALRWIMDYGADGFRCDLEPEISGYDVFRRIREECRSRGKEILLISEMRNERMMTYDLEQVGVGNTHPTNGTNDYLYLHNIVDVCRAGKDLALGGSERFYTIAMSNHDCSHYNLKMSPLRLGYEMMFSPFVPLLFAGDEFGNKTVLEGPECECIFFNPIDWAQAETNKEFIETFRKFSAIRKRYKELFWQNFDSIRNANIAKAETDLPLQAYVRYAGGVAAAVIGNPGKRKQQWKVLRGSWTEQYGELSQNTFDYGLMQLEGFFPSSPTIRVNILSNNTYDEFPLRQGGSGLSFGPYQVMFYTDRTLKILKYGEQIAVTKTAESVRHGIDVEIKADAAARTIAVHVGGAPVLSLFDAEYSDGGIFLCTDFAHTHYRDFRLYGADGQILFEDDFIGEPQAVTVGVGKKEAGLRSGIKKCLDPLSGREYELHEEEERYSFTCEIPGNDLFLAIIGE